MNLKLWKKSKRFQQDAGIALLTTILLLFLMSSLLVGFAVLLMSNQQLAGANNDQVAAFYAAEAGMEKMTADLGNLFGQGPGGLISGLLGGAGGGAQAAATAANTTALAALTTAITNTQNGLPAVSKPSNQNDTLHAKIACTAAAIENAVP